MKIGLLSPGIVGFSIFRGEPDEIWAYFLGSLIFINILLAAFNLIPVAPLDGFKVVQGLLPRDLAMQWSQLERWGPLILMVLILSGFILPTGASWYPSCGPWSMSLRPSSLVDRFGANLVQSLTDRERYNKPNG